jgi:5-methylcytosine-specific restriction enzyme subunit McrC
MFEQPHINIEAADCCIFQNQEGHGEALQYFISNSAKWNTFHFITESESDEPPEIALFNHREAKWYAGRLIGEATFDFSGKRYRIIVRPRFGSAHLFRMLEEVYNVRFSPSKTLVNRQDDFQYIVKKLIAFLWLNLLARANKHGLPKHNICRTYKGSTIRGRINITKSVKPLFLEERLICTFREKTIDSTISKLLNLAYCLLVKDYYLDSLNMPSNAQDAINQIESYGAKSVHISERDFKNITYKDIYLSYKPVVELSWDIIRKQNIGSNQTQANSNSFGFFIDMAEIWELYLKSLLQRNLSRLGWLIKPKKEIAYKLKDFRRALIPDIVFQRDNEIMVWDAKYKRMNFDYYDYDRSDFFQIHTYISYYNQTNKVVAGGLLYPISKVFNTDRQKKNYSKSLFSLDSHSTQFVVDGIDLSGYDEDNSRIDFLKSQELYFIERICSLIKIA